MTDSLRKINQQRSEAYDRRKVRIISIVSFIYGFSGAVCMYVWGTYFERVLGTDNVGPFFVVAYAVLLFALSYLHRLVKWWGKSTTLFVTLAFNVIAATILAAVAPGWIGIVLLMSYIVGTSIVWVELDVMLESFSVDAMSGRIRGLYLTVLNLGFIPGPYVASLLIDRYDFAGAFTAAAVLYAIILVIALFGLRNVNHEAHDIGSFREVLRRAWSRKNISRVYLVSFALDFFYAVMVIFMPIYLLSLGFGWSDIGIMYTIMLIPFVIVQYPAGILADRRIGEKEMIVVSLLAIGIPTAAISVLDSKNILVWGMVLFATRIGAAMIEVLRDSYFYKQIDGHDVDLIHFFRTASPVAYISAAVISSILVPIFSIKAMFIIGALVSWGVVFSAIKLEDSLPESEIIPSIGKKEVA